MSSKIKVILTISFFSSFLLNGQITQKGKSEISSGFEVWKIHMEMKSYLDENNFLTKRIIGYRDIVKPSNCIYPIEVTKLEENQLFPLEEYSLYEVVIEDCWVCGETTHTFGIPKYYTSLIAYNPVGEKVIFISGSFFLSKISRYFNLEDIIQLQQFLQLKLNDFSLILDKNIVDEKWVFVRMINQQSSRVVNLKFEKENPDIILIVE